MVTEDRIFISADKIHQQGYVPAAVGAPKYLLDDKVKLDYLKSYARDFAKAADIAKTTGDITKLNDIGVSKDDAKDFLTNNKTNPDFAYEKMAAKEFTKKLWGTDGDKKHALGIYDENTTKFLTGVEAGEKDYYKAAVRDVLHPTHESLDELSKVANDFKSKVKELAASTGREDIQDVEKMSEYGVGKKSPVCRNYASVMSQMLREAGIKNHVVSCNATGVGDYGLSGAHETVFSDKTAANIEATTYDPNNSYFVALASDSAKGVNTQHPLQALKDGGSVVLVHPSLNPKSVRVINTKSGANADLSELGTTRFIIDSTAKSLESRDWGQAKQAAVGAMTFTHVENQDKNDFSVSPVRAFLKKDSEPGFWDKIRKAVSHDDAAQHHESGNLPAPTTQQVPQPSSEASAHR